MGAPAWKTGLTAQSSLHEIVNMGGETISLFTFKGKRRSGKEYSVECYVVRDADTRWKSSGVFQGNVHRVDGKPSTRNCHEVKDGDLLDAMKESIRSTAEWCWWIDGLNNLTNSVSDGVWTYGSPSVEAIVKVRLAELNARKDAA